MEVRQKLLIELRSSISGFITSLERHLPEVWARSHEMEKPAQVGLTGSEQYCFVLNGADHLPHAYVWIGAKSSSLLHVTDILPHGRQFSIAECNQILQKFLYEAVTPAANECGAAVDLSSADVKLEDLLRPYTAEKLWAFSRSADKTTGPANPEDIERWQDFLIEAHRTGWELTTDQLGRWLSEEEGWPDDSVTTLMLEYEFAHELLQAYDKKLAR